MSNENTPFETASTNTLRIEEHIENVITVENSEALFQCKVDGDPQPICAWFKDGVPIISSQRTKITSNRKWHRLEITNVKATDHGLYTVVCRNSSKQISSKANLFVGYKNVNDGVVYADTISKEIRVVKHLCDVKVEKGEKIELEATFKHKDNEEVTYIWFRNNVVVKQDERTIILSSKKTSILSIIISEVTDSGVYCVVAKSKHGVDSSFADVQVTTVKESYNDDELCPLIEELLPDELETNEGEEIRMICKAMFDINTSIQWLRNGSSIKNSNFIAEDYGDHYIGLRGVNISRTDAAEYTVCLRDENTTREESSSCCLTVNVSPKSSIPIVKLKRPLESAVACCGSKVTFNCQFAIQDPKYFYVVWHVGFYTVKRTNNQFSVVQNGDEFVLFIKNLEIGMSGEVVCELRKVILPNKRFVHVTQSSANLNPVPMSVMPEEKRINTSLKKGKLFNNAALCDKLDYADILVENGLTDIDASAERSANGNGHDVANVISDVLLEITYVRLNADGLFYLNASKLRSEVDVCGLMAKETQRNDCLYVDIEWDTADSTTCWYGIEMGQSDGRFVLAGVSSLPSFKLVEPPIERMMRFRIRKMPPEINANESSFCILPPPATVLKPRKIHTLRPMEEFELNYTNTNYQIGAGAFGKVMLIHDVKGEYYAAKILTTRYQKRRLAAMREFETMKKLRHPKLVELVDAFALNDSIILVMDYLWGGELFERVIEEDNIMEVDVIPYVKQILEALRYLHSCQIAHLDLKPENIVCLSPNSRQVKLIDFGLARVLDDGLVNKGFYGTKDYVAPEILNFEQLTLACDMWSMGVVTYMLLSGVMPFAANSLWERSAKITSATYNYDDIAFYDVSDLAKNFVDHLLVRKAGMRMTAAEALEHEWIKQGPPKGVKAGYMKQTKENLKTYLAIYREKWQRVGNVVRAAHRLRTQAGSTRASAESDTPDRNT